MSRGGKPELVPIRSSGPSGSPQLCRKSPPAGYPPDPMSWAPANEAHVLCRTLKSSAGSERRARHYDALRQRYSATQARKHDDSEQSGVVIRSQTRIVVCRLPPNVVFVAEQPRRISPSRMTASPRI